jgi:VanZ family protein
MTSKKRARSAAARVSWIHSSRLHVVMYSMLLVATPFILLQSFLMEAISGISGTTFPVGDRNIPVLPVVGLVVVIAAGIYFRRRLTRRLIAAVVVAVLMIALSQQITDYYFDHNFYDLQQNWHYLAYAIFAYMMYRDLRPRGWPVARIMLLTFFAAMFFSTFDETFQRFMSSRVFDVSDIAKDVWGTLTGMVLVYLGGPLADDLLAGWKKLRHRRLRDYFGHAPSALILMAVLAFLLVCTSSLLSDFEHWPVVVLLTVGGFVVFFGLFHLSQYKWCKYTLLTLAVLAVVAQGWSYVKYRSSYVVHNQFGLIVYKGVPVVFFDVLVFPDGSFRPVDKKHYFNTRDQTFFLKRKPDILLIGSGYQGLGGRGFFDTAPNQFIYNPYTRQGTQVIILPTPEACELFNRMKRAQKNVLFVIHSTC